MGSKESETCEGVKGNDRPQIGREHILRQGRKATRPQHVVFFDTETKWTDHKDGSQTHRLRLGWGCYINYRNIETKTRRKDWRFFTTQKQFYKWLSSKIKPKRTLYCIGSNVWFDIRITEIDLWLLAHDYRCESLYDRGLVTILRYSKGKSVVVFYAIQNYFRLSVDRLGMLLGLPKLKINFRTVTAAKLKTYCKRDVEILIRAFTYWLAFIEQRWSGSFGVTISQQALNIYRSAFMTRQITIHTDEQAIELERTGYFGGRTEPFFIGKAPARVVHKLDINSQYPFVMQKYKYPCKLVHVEAEPDIKFCMGMLKNYGLMALVSIRLKEPYIASRVEGKTCFPIGKFDAVVSTEAFKRLADDGSLLSVSLVAFYDMADLFSEYIHHFNNLKESYDKAGDEIGRACAKYLMNCLYGKFGQRRETIVGVENVDIELLENIALIDEQSEPCGRIITYGGVRKWYGPDEVNTNHTFVAIAAHVTENARLLLWDYKKQAGHKNTYYCDTDSLFVNSKGRVRLKRHIHPTKLGKLKDEGTAKSCVLYGPKDYVLDGAMTCKGIRRDAIRVDKNTYEQQRFASFRTFLEGNIHDKYKVTRIRKKLARNYDKGIVEPSGWVTPFTLPL